MMEMVELMAAPFVACVVLVGIHAYLGMHVIQRKVIFVDLALAQIAALGATFGYLLGISPHDREAYYFSLGFAIVGAAIFAVTRMRHERIPQEAIIGIVYSVALAGAILVADRAPEGAEHIKETLVGMLLWVQWPVIAKTAVIYGVVGLIHFLLRKRIFQISFDVEKAYAQKRWIRLWDFIFYVTFAFVITSSVAIAGVLVVFSFLVIPAVIATLFATKISIRLAISWAVGITACLLGLISSYRFDLPSGPAVVTSLGIALLLAGLLYYIVHAPKKRYAALKVLAGMALVAGLVAGLAIFSVNGSFLHIEHHHEWEDDLILEEHSGDRTGMRTAIIEECGEDLSCAERILRQDPDWLATVTDRLVAADTEGRDWWVSLLGMIGEAGDPLERLRIGELLVAEGNWSGKEMIVEILAPDTPPLARDEAHQAVIAMAGDDFGYDPFAGPEENREPLERIRAWLESEAP